MREERRGDESSVGLQPASSSTAGDGTAAAARHDCCCADGNATALALVTPAWSGEAKPSTSTHPVMNVDLSRDTRRKKSAVRLGVREGGVWEGGMREGGLACGLG